MTIALPTAVARVYKAVCPGLVTNRHYAIAGITQTYTVDDNQKVTIPVQDFYDNYIAAAAPLLLGDTTKIDIVQPFIDGLDEDLREIVDQRNPYRGQLPTLNTRLSMNRLLELLAIASEGQKEINKTSKLISNVVSGNGPNFTGVPVPNQAAVPPPSQAIVPPPSQVAAPALPAPSQIIPSPNQVPQALQQWASAAVQQQSQAAVPPPNQAAVPAQSQAVVPPPSQAAVPALPAPSQVIPPPYQYSHAPWSWLCPPVPAYPSQAERTLQQHQGQPRTNFCWGCGDLFPYIPNHYWFDKVQRRITCPNQHIDGTTEAAELRRATYHQKRLQEIALDPANKRARTAQNPQSALLQAPASRPRIL